MLGALIGAVALLMFGAPVIHTKQKPTCPPDTVFIRTVVTRGWHAEPFTRVRIDTTRSVKIR